MFDSIFIGTSGLVGFSKALRVVSNNLANVNTTGFKGSQVNFGDYFYESPSSSTGYANGGLNNPTQLGTGLNTLGTQINFRAGPSQGTGNPLDLLVNGNGYFILKTTDGKLQYTRDGSFALNDGFVVSRVNGLHVQGFDGNGKLSDISVDSLLTNPAKASTNVKLTGILASDAIADVTVNGVQVLDTNGVSHSLSLTLHKNSSGNYTVTAMDGSTTIGTGTIVYGASPTSKFNINYTPAGGTAFTFSLDFSGTTNNILGSAPSTIAFDKQEGGNVAGGLTSVTFDTDGKLQASYSNGQTAAGPSLALARFDNETDLRQLGGNLFDSIDPTRAHIGRANSGQFGSITGSTLEGSNVDLAQSFSDLIVMQRGYQASSRVISTANELIQELFDMKGRN